MTLKKKREKSRCLRNSLIMIHPKLMTDTDRLIKGFAVYICIPYIYCADYILRLAHSKSIILTVNSGVTQFLFA